MSGDDGKKQYIYILVLFLSLSLSLSLIVLSGVCLSIFDYYLTSAFFILFFLVRINKINFYVCVFVYLAFHHLSFHDYRSVVTDEGKGNVNMYMDLKK